LNQWRAARNFDDLTSRSNLENEGLTNNLINSQRNTRTDFFFESAQFSFDLIRAHRKEIDCKDAGLIGDCLAGRTSVDVGNLDRDSWYHCVCRVRHATGNAPSILRDSEGAEDANQN
jgi:hypothetical protein